MTKYAESITITNMTLLHPFYDLAGSSFLTLPNNLDLTDLKNILIDSKAIILARNNKIKVIFDTYNITDIQSILGEVFVNKQINSKNNIKIESYNSNFFQIQKTQQSNILNLNTQLNWQNYESEFLTEEISPQNIDQIAIIHNLLINSFGITTNQEKNQKKIDYINQNLGQDINNPDMLSFLVKDYSNNIVGCYSLTAIGIEAQLSAVAGRSTLTNSYKNGKKLPVLSASMIHQFETHLHFKQYKNLTLSNSKQPVAKFYSDLGIPTHPTRQGLLINL